MLSLGKRLAPNILVHMLPVLIHLFANLTLMRLRGSHISYLANFRFQSYTHTIE